MTIHQIYTLSTRQGLRLWCLMPLSTIFQLYRGTDYLGSCKSTNDHDYDGPLPIKVSTTYECIFVSVIPYHT